MFRTKKLSKNTAGEPRPLRLEALEARDVPATTTATWTGGPLAAQFDLDKDDTYRQELERINWWGDPS